MDAFWQGIRFVVFDIDGTLYHQEKLRRLMLRALLLDLARTGNTRTLKLLRAYRKERETIAETEIDDFETVLRQRIADRQSCSGVAVDAIVSEWIDRRPLPYLRRCAVAGVQEAFAKVRRSGRMIGVLSDYPATAKLAALGLEADFMAGAGDHGVQRMKPHPAGLQHLIAQAGVPAASTLMVGDREERDVAAARRAGTRWLLRTAKPSLEDNRFATFLDAPFDVIPLLHPEPA